MKVTHPPSTNWTTVHAVASGASQPADPTLFRRAPPVLLVEIKTFVFAFQQEFLSVSNVHCGLVFRNGRRKDAPRAVVIGAAFVELIDVSGTGHVAEGARGLVALGARPVIDEQHGAFRVVAGMARLHVPSLVDWQKVLRKKRGGKGANE